MEWITNLNLILIRIPDTLLGMTGFVLTGLYTFLLLKCYFDGNPPSRMLVRLIFVVLQGLACLLLAAAAHDHPIARAALYIVTIWAFSQLCEFIWKFMISTRLRSASSRNDRGEVRIFTNFVSTSVIRRRLLHIMLLGGVMGVFYPIAGFWWPMIIPIAVIAGDLLLIVYRKELGFYGESAVEFAESVRYVITETTSGRGPGRFDRIFPEPTKQDSIAPIGGAIRPV